MSTKKKKSTVIEPTPVGDELVMLDRNDVQPNDFNRRVFDPTKLEELAESLRNSGQWTPILVRRRMEEEIRPGEPRFEIVFGERRWRACGMANLPTVMAVVKPLSRMEAMEANLIENIQREDLSPLEQARALQMALDEHVAPSMRELAKRLGCGVSWVSKLCSLLKLPEAAQNMVRSGALPIAVANAMTTLETEDGLLGLVDHFQKFPPTQTEGLDAVHRVRLEEECSGKWEQEAETLEVEIREAVAAEHQMEIHVKTYKDRAVDLRRMIDAMQSPDEALVAVGRRKELANQKPTVLQIAAELRVPVVIGTKQPFNPSAAPLAWVDFELLLIAEENLAVKDRWFRASTPEDKHEQAIEAEHEEQDMQAECRQLREEFISALKMLVQIPDKDKINGLCHHAVCLAGNAMLLDAPLSTFWALAEAVNIERVEDQSDEQWQNFVRRELLNECESPAHAIAVMLFADCWDMTDDGPRFLLNNTEAHAPIRDWWDAAGLELADFPAWQKMLQA